MVPGGQNNSAEGGISFAAGRNAKATNNNAFVWGGCNLSTVVTASTNEESFTVRAPGGVRFITTTNSTFAATNNGVILQPNANSWAALSDSNAKTAIKPIKPREILAKLALLPVTEWEYKGQPNRSYIGPMAQDFHAAFGLGQDDKTITTADTDGVMYAAIQGLVEELKDRDREIEELKAWSREQGARSQAEIEEFRAKSAEVDGLKAKLQSLENRLNSLPPAP
jgi:hypothetical protein